MVAFSKAEALGLGPASGLGGLADLGLIETPSGRAWQGVLAGGAGLLTLLQPEPEDTPGIAAYLALLAENAPPAGPQQPAFLTGPGGQALGLLGPEAASLRWLDPAAAIGPENSLAPAVPDRVVDGIGLGAKDLQGQDLYALATAGGRVMVVALAPGAPAVLRADLAVGDDAGLPAGAALPADLAVVGTAQGRHLLVSLPGADSVLSYALAPDGSAHLAGRIGAAEGMSIASPVAIAAAAGGTTGLAVVAGQASSGLVVLEVGADGAPEVRDQIMDSLALRIGGVSQVQTVSHGDLSLVLAGGAERGLSLFALGPDARLYHLASTEAAPGVDFGSLAALAVASEGPGLRVLAAPQGADFVAGLTVDLSSLGVIAVGADAVGTARDDILIATQDHNMLQGGAGADLFVFTPEGASPDRDLGMVMDFDPTADRLDLSAVPMLMDISQVQVTPQADGAVLQFRGFSLGLHSAGGGPITAADLSNDSLFDAMHLPFFPTGQWDPLPDDPPPATSPNFFDFLPMDAEAPEGTQSWQDWAGASARTPLAAELPEILGYYDLVL